MQETAQEIPERTSPWRRAALPAALLGALLVVAFRGPLAGRLFYLRDISQNHYPMRHFVTERLRSLALPLWDPYHGGGTPLLADPNNLVLHPISALFLILPFDAAFSASIVLQFALLAWGGYLLAHALRVGREGAALAAAVMALSGPAASLASLQNVLSAAAWVPIGVWAYLRGLEPGRRHLLPLAAVALSVVLITGEVASLLAFLLLAAGLAATGSTGPGRAGGRGVALGALLTIGLLALLLSAAQILPARELLALSVRGPGFAAPDGLKWSLEPTRLVEMVVPWIFGDPTRLSPQSWWGRWLFEGNYPFLLSIYVGAIPCLLAALGLAHHGPDRARRRVLAVIGLLALLLALGRNGVLYRGLFSILPALRRVRYPERFLLTGLFPLALLSAIGLDRLLHGDEAWRRRSVRRVFVAAAAAFALVTLVASASSLVDRFLAVAASVPAGLFQSEAGASVRGAILRSSLWTFGETVLLALASALALGRAGSRLRTLAAWGIVGVSGLSMVIASEPVRSTAAPGWVEAPSPLAPIVAHGPNAARLHHDPRPDDLSVWATTDELAWGYRFDRFTYSLASGHRDLVPTILEPATDQMDLRPQVDLGREMASRPLEDRIKILSICGAGFLISYVPLAHPDLEPVPALEGFSRPPARLYRVTSPLQRARIVARAARPSAPGDLGRSLSDPRFDPAREVLLEMPAAEPAQPEPGDPGSAVIVEDRPEKVRIEVKTPSNGYLVLSDAFAPGWRAAVDGRPVDLLRANGLFRAVAIGRGSHEISMSYRPWSVVLGLTLSLCAVFATLAWWTAAARSGL